MITISLPTPTPKAVWKKISHIIRYGKRQIYNFTVITPVVLSSYAQSLEDNYNIDYDYIQTLYIEPQWKATIDKLARG